MFASMDTIKCHTIIMLMHYEISLPVDLLVM